MKYIIAALLFMTSVAFAADCDTQESAEEATDKLEIKTDVPNHLKGATVCVRLADGKESCVPAEKFKVVPRQQQFIVTKTEKSKVTVCSVKEYEKNRVSALIGKGPTGALTHSTSDITTSVQSEDSAVGGVQYQRMMNDKLSLGVQGQTNGTVSAILGVDF